LPSANGAIQRAGRKRAVGRGGLGVRDKVGRAFSPWGIFRFASRRGELLITPRRWRCRILQKLGGDALVFEATHFVEMAGLRANGPLSFQPGATPQEQWRDATQALKGRDNGCSALSGLDETMTQSQGVALGWHVPHRWRLTPAAVNSSITCIVAMVRLRANGPLSFQPGATPQEQWPADFAQAPTVRFSTRDANGRLVVVALGCGKRSVGLSALGEFSGLQLAAASCS